MRLPDQIKGNAHDAQAKRAQTLQTLLRLSKKRSLLETLLVFKDGTMTNVLRQSRKRTERKRRKRKGLDKASHLIQGWQTASFVRHLDLVQLNQQKVHVVQARKEIFLVQAKKEAQ